MYRELSPTTIPSDALDKDVLADKERRKYPHRDRDLLELAGDSVAEDIRDNAQEDAVGNAVGKRHHYKGYEGGDSLAVVFPVDALN